MKSWSLPGILLLIALTGQVLSLTRADRARELLPLAVGADYALPPQILKLSALEFDGLLSDVIFLKTLSFYGKTFERTERPRVRESELNWINDSLTAATELDPYFLDPYYLANSTLAWEGDRVKQANLLLEKGAQYRQWDWLLPFYAGFNHYYFLHDNARAAKLLEEAARRSGGNPLLATLAARLSYESNQTESAIIFLEEMLRQATDDYSRREYGQRLTALKDILALEKNVAEYQAKVGRAPTALSDLLEQGIVHGLPREPYGGTYYFDQESKTVRSSTDLGKKAAADKPIKFFNK